MSNQLLPTTYRITNTINPNCRRSQLQPQPLKAWSPAETPPGEIQREMGIVSYPRVEQLLAPPNPSLSLFPLFLPPSFIWPIEAAPWHHCYYKFFYFLPAENVQPGFLPTFPHHSMPTYVVPAAIPSPDFLRQLPLQHNFFFGPAEDRDRLGV
jgi:hypothetical protein